MRTNSDELELGEYISILRRRWIWFLLPLLVIPWLAYFMSVSQPDRYQATARVLFGDTAAQAAVDAGSQNTSFRARLLENEIRLATSDAAAAEVAQRFDEPIGEAPRATVSAESGADILQFRADADDAESAANIANAWAEAYLDLKALQTQASIDGAVSQLEAKLAELQDERETVRADLVELEDRLATATDATREIARLRVDREASRISGQVTLIDAQIAATAASITDLTLSADLAQGSGPRLITAATPPPNRSNAPASRNVVLGLVVGAILGAAVALLRENLDRAVRTQDDLEALGLVHLGSIPAVKRAGGDLALASLEMPDSPTAAAYQKVRSAIDFMRVERDLPSIVVTSAVQGEGKTTTAANLATAMAQANHRTILIDGDLRRPRIHKAFKTKQSPGFTNTALEPATLAESAWPIPSLAESFVVLPSGALPPSPPSFISSPGFGKAMSRLASLGDFTIIDAPPVLPVADTLSLANHAAAVLMVVDAGRTSKDDLQRAVTSIQQAGSEILGAVLIGVEQRAKAYEYSYAGDGDVERLCPDEMAAGRGANGDMHIELDSDPDQIPGQRSLGVFAE